MLRGNPSLYKAYKYDDDHNWMHDCTVTSVREQVDGVTQFLKDTSERFTNFFETEIVTIKIGEDKTYLVHKEALARASKVIKKQIESGLKEGQTKEITFDDFTADGLAFSLFIQFAYFGGYGYDEVRYHDALQVHASVYVLAEKLEVLELKALALKKATKLCSNATSGNQPSDLKLLTELLSGLRDAVPTIYDCTYDANTGKLPSTLVESGVTDQVKMVTTTRDGFRMLLSNFAAAYIQELRRNESFMSILEGYPAFSSDVLLFTGTGSKFSTDGEGNLKF
ncbi:hypothetical protein ABW20_dc0103965 [Dactylellina cionopaga]|nr:hypothetical protein ABW20_dc0103965 [Dactylellina cionopaga]